MPEVNDTVKLCPNCRSFNDLSESNICQYCDFNLVEGKFEELMAQPGEVFAAMKKYMVPGEQLRHAAYGLQQSTLLIIVALIAMLLPATLITVLLVGANAGLFGSLVFFIVWGISLIPVLALLRKDYMVGLTDQRLLVVRIKMPIFTVNLNDVVSVSDYPLARARQAETKIGLMRVFIKLKDAQSSINLQFGGRGLSSNYKEAVEIAHTLSGK